MHRICVQRENIFLRSEGEKIILKGMGLGGWLVREGYMLQTPGSGSPTDIENKITNLIGPDSAKVFFQKI